METARMAEGILPFEVLPCLMLDHGYNTLPQGLRGKYRKALNSHKSL